ncbi:MAG TPA: DUF2844 domain-containing protein [Anaeromyxobacteraceae bacterium]|nr:DUF2844 domain-containing protein [Anaeromyxobacteraceae bacterium]
MARRLFAPLLALGLVLSVAAAALPAVAALGEPVASVASDTKALAATRRADTARQGYTVHELATGGSVVREFSSPAGVVFGIAWQGIAEPDLTPLLGSYLTEYRASLAETPPARGRRSQQVIGAHVVVERWGHMRNIRGRAYVPALLPSGVTAHDIQ